MLQRMYDDGQQRNGMSLDVRHKYSLSNKKKSSQKRIRKGLLLFRRISINLYIQKTLFRNEHILFILKPQSLDRLSNLWANGFDTVHSDYLHPLLQSLAALMKLFFFFFFFLIYFYLLDTLSSVCNFTILFNLSFLFFLFLLMSSMQLLCIFPLPRLPFLDITWTQHNKIVGFIFR